LVASVCHNNNQFCIKWRNPALPKYVQRRYLLRCSVYSIFFIGLNRYLVLPKTSAVERTKKVDSNMTSNMILVISEYVEKNFMANRTRRQKRVPKNKKEAKQDKAVPMNKSFDQHVKLALLAAVGILLFYPPYFRGLFFATEMLTTHLATTAVFLLWSIGLLTKKDEVLRIGLLDWLVLGYAAVYCLSIIGAVDTRQAMSGALKAFNYGLIYFLVAQITVDLRMFKNWLVVLYASSVGVALVGIGCAIGYVHYPAGFDGQNITSTLQYTNATSAYMAIMAIVGVTLALTSKKFWWQVLFSFTASLLILVSINSASKGAWLIFIFALFLFLIGMPARYRIKSVYFFIVTLFAGLASSNLFMLNVQNERPGMALASLSLGLAIVMVASLIWQGMVRFQQAHGIWKTTVLSVSGLGLAIAGGWILVGNRAVATVGNITAEMAQLTDMQNSSFVSRWAMYRDAASIIKDHPILGTGAGGWNLLYHQYQDFLYWTTEVHNHLLQVGVETGIPGMLLWLGLFVALAYYIYKIRRNGVDDQGGILVWGVGTAIFALGAHSLIDFDLSIPSLQILFFALLGLVASAFRPHSKPVELRNSKRMLWAGVTLSVAIALLSGSFLFAILMSNHGTKMAQAGDYQSALLNFQKASAFDSFNSQYHAAQARLYAQLYVAKAGGESLSSQWFSSSAHHANLAEAKSPYDPKVIADLAVTYGLLGSSEEAIRLADRVVELNPWDINAYNNLASIHTTHAIRYLEAGDRQNAKKCIEHALAIPERIEQQAAKVQEDLLPFWSGARLVPDSNTVYILAQAHYYRGDYVTSLQEFEQLMSQSLASGDGFKILYASALYKNGKQADAEQVMTDIKTSKPGMYAQYLKIRDLPAITEG